MVRKESERQEIIAAAKFLEDKGYKRKVNEYFVTYSNDAIDFLVGYERYYDEQGDINIKFKNKKINSIRLHGLWLLEREQKQYNKTKRVIYYFYCHM